MGQVYFDEHCRIIPAFEPHQESSFDEQLNVELEAEVQRRVKDEIAHALWEGVSRFAAEILATRNPRLTVTAFCIAAGLYTLEGKSMTQLAAENGVSRAALSDRCVKITEKLGLPPSRTMKSLASRAAYSRTQLKRNNGNRA